MPFAIGDGDARDRLAAWLRARRPLGSRRRPTVDRVRAVYVPCWTFSAKVRVPWRAEEQRTDRDGRTEQIAIDGVEALSFDDEVVAAAASIPAELLRRIDPVVAAGLVPYDARYCAGYQVEVYAVNLWDAWDAADARFQNETDRAVRAAAGRGAIGLETWPEWSDQVCRQVLVPVYVVDYTFGGAAHMALVHGHSGQVDGTHAPDRLARLLAIAVLLAVLAGAIWLVLLAIRWLVPA